MDVGPIMPGFSGGQVISWCEIQAWADATDHNPTQWEKEALRQMSAAYADWLKKGEDMAQRAPWEEGQD